MTSMSLYLIPALSRTVQTQTADRIRSTYVESVQMIIWSHCRKQILELREKMLHLYFHRLKYVVSTSLERSRYSPRYHRSPWLVFLRCPCPGPPVSRDTKHCEEKINGTQMMALMKGFFLCLMGKHKNFADFLHQLRNHFTEQKKFSGAGALCVQ